MYQQRIQPDAFVAEPAWLGRVDFRSVATADLRARARFEVLRDGSVHGIAGWFRSEIAEGVELQNAPGDPDSSWKQLFLPLEAPLAVRTKDALQLELAVRENGAVWTWSLVVLH
jgi:protein arginine N-methyltransferase 1